MDQRFDRRRFLQFMGASAAATSVLAGCAQGGDEGLTQDPEMPDVGPFKPLPPSSADAVTLAEGLTHEVLIGWGDPINAQGDKFGFNNDYIAQLPDPKGDPDHLLLWVNHETASTYFVGGAKQGDPRTKKAVDKEMAAVGGSILRLYRDPATRSWRVVPNDPLNRRISAFTPMRFAPDQTIAGSNQPIGTLSNCAGGFTPWGTFLTCEENAQDNFGDVSFVDGKRVVEPGYPYQWHLFYDHPPEHYGWVVEIDPVSGACKKLVGLGRFGHEGATVVEGADGRCAVYSGDDDEDQCVYKFIADRPGSLESGTLYVADLGNGRWVPLDIETNPALREAFSSQTELLVRCREAAKIVGGTPLARPEDIEVTQDGKVFVALTNNKDKGNYHGSLLKIAEDNGDPLSLTFTSDTYLAGGPETGFTCPDNLAIDKRGNLWITCDISSGSIGKGPYAGFGNNAMFYIPLHGPHAGKAYRIAVGPNDCELTGPCFSPDGRTLFLAVQHPGSGSRTAGRLTSHWPDGGESLPRPAVICIQGPLLDELVG